MYADVAGSIHVDGSARTQHLYSFQDFTEISERFLVVVRQKHVKNKTEKDKGIRMRKVLYEELLPEELVQRIQEMPVAYLPLGTLEWHGPVAKFEENGIVGFVQGAGQGAFNIDTFHAICDNIEPGAFTKAALGEIEWTDSEVFTQALDLWKTLFDEGIMQDGALGMTQYPEANNLFMSQKAAMVMMGSWYTMNCLPDTMKANMEAASSTDDPFTMVPINFPDIAGTGNVGYVFSDIDYANGVATTAADVDAATKFCVWLGASEEGQQLIADSLNLVPVLKSVTPDWDNVVLTNPEKQNDAVQAYLENCVNNAENPRFGSISADLNEQLSQVLAGVASEQIDAATGVQMLADAE